jgi:hypothetical protein
MAVIASLDEALAACNADPTVATLVALLVVLIRNRIDVDHLSRTSVFSHLKTLVQAAGMTLADKKKLFDYVICWQEQANDERAVEVMMNVPDKIFLDEVTDLATEELPADSVAVQKLWCLRIFHSLDRFADIAAYDQDVDGYERMKNLFRLHVPVPDVEAEFVVQFRGDRIRSLRYRAVLAMLAQYYDEDGLHRDLTHDILERCYQAEIEDNIFRPSNREDLRALRISLRTSLAMFCTANRSWVDVISHLSVSAAEQMLNRRVYGTDGQQYRLYLRLVVHNAGSFVAESLRTLFGMGAGIPHEAAQDFAFLVVARANLMRLNNEVNAGMELLEVAKDYLYGVSPPVHGGVVVDDGLSLNYNLGYQVLSEGLIQYARKAMGRI